MHSVCVCMYVCVSVRVHELKVRMEKEGEDGCVRILACCLKRTLVSKNFTFLCGFT